jgi:dolichyl-phosphate-mannose--protein O-mannosyl transferase
VGKAPLVTSRRRAIAKTEEPLGTQHLTRTDVLLMAGLIVVAFVIAVVNLAVPAEKIFDEVYFARAGNEYIHHIPPWEWTHPMFTKEIIASSILLFGDNSFGWRFMNVVVGALEVGVIYAFAKRLTASTLFAATAGAFLLLDGFHFTESRISTGEITISTLILIVLYAFHRYWETVQTRIERLVHDRFGWPFIWTMAGGVLFSAGFAYVANIQPASHAHTEQYAKDIYNSPGAGPYTYETAFCYALLGVYLFARIVLPRWLKPAGARISYADGTSEVVKTWPGIDRVPTIWLGVLLLSLGLLASSKWNGAFDFAVVIAIVLMVWGTRVWPGRPPLGNPNGFPLDIVFGLIVFVTATIYTITYLPLFLLGNGHSLSDMLTLQQIMLYYHSHVGGTHPYMSVWWQWPIMQVPVTFYWHDFAPPGATATAAGQCCVAMITSLPNPVVFLAGLVTVPYVAWLAVRERNRGYVLLIVAYALQWLPWFHSPRMLFEYHFFPNLAIIVLCDIIALQRLCLRMPREEVSWSVASVVIAVAATFVFFYPVLTGMHISHNAWYARMLPDVLQLPHTSWIMPPR